MRLAIEIDPARARSWFGLGNALGAQARWRDAAEAFERGLSLDPELPNGDAVAAQAWEQAGEPTRAAYRYLRSISGVRGREDPELLSATAKSLAALGRVDEPIALYEQVAALLPHNAAAQSNLGISYQAAARYDEAIECYRRAIQLAPTIPECWSNLMVCLNYSPASTPEEVRSTALEYQRQCVAASVAPPSEIHANDRSPERKLRIGYVSPDLHRHPVAYFLLPALESRTDQTHVICYYTGEKGDLWTDRLRRASDGWVDGSQMSDQELASQIRADRIDILVDLAGHTEGNRLFVFALKPAPVQITWLGYVLTTGLEAIDWRIGYELTDPPGSECYYSEKLWRLPVAMWGWRAPPEMPEPSASPFLRKGYVTFGHLNRSSKISTIALDCWIQILAHVPNAKLILALPPGSRRSNMARLLEERGIAAQRIEVFETVPHDQFWALHSEIDIALDPFPFNGGTTSYETLWLGVPVVTCTGESGGFAPRFSSRMGKALLSDIDVPELVAGNPDEYVRVAVALASNPLQLMVLRQELRSRMAGSSLMDEGRQAAVLDEAYRGMWKEWCLKR